MAYENVPLGFFKQHEMDKDIKYNVKQVHYMDYVETATYFTHFNPISHDVLQTVMRFDDCIMDVIKQYDCNLYEIEIILGGQLKDMTHCKYARYYSWECDKLERKDVTKVYITLPEWLTPDTHNILMATAYYPNRLFYLTWDE